MRLVRNDVNCEERDVRLANDRVDHSFQREEWCFQWNVITVHLRTKKGTQLRRKDNRLKKDNSAYLPIVTSIVWYQPNGRKTNIGQMYDLNAYENKTLSETLRKITVPLMILKTNR